MCIKRITFTFLLQIGKLALSFITNRRALFDENILFIFLLALAFSEKKNLSNGVLLLTPEKGNLDYRTTLICRNMRICNVLPHLRPTYSMCYF